MLRKLVADLVPLGLRANEHVRGWLERRRLAKCSVGHAKPRAIVMLDGPAQEGRALCAPGRVHGIGVAGHEQRIRPARERELPWFDLAPRKEG